MDVSNLSHNTLNALGWRAEKELVEGHPLRTRILNQLPEADSLKADMQAALKTQQDEEFLKTLGTQDQEIYQAFKRNVLNGVFSPEKHAEALRQQFGDGLPAAQSRYQELVAIQEPLKQAYREKMGVFAQRMLEAKKKIFATPEGRELILKTMNKQLADHDQQWGRWFSGALKGADTPAHIHLSHASPDSFSWALEGHGDNHSLNTLINQAKELSYLEEKPLSEIMPARLKAVGLTDFQADFFTDITKAYENGTHDEFLKNLYEKHKPEIERLQAEQQANLERALRGTGDVSAEAGATRAASEASGVTSKVENVSNDVTKLAEEGRGFVKWLSRHKAPVAIGAAAVAAIGGWALYENSRRKEPKSHQSVKTPG